MKILFDNKWFIGAVNFFDHNKGFGFIATNGLSYYVDNSSFTEPSLKAEHGIVVFQVARQADGKKKAVNVRKLIKQEEDYKLVLDCFPDQGKIMFKNGDWTNILLRTNTFVPRPLFISRLVELIESNASRTPQSTLGLFRDFVILFAHKGEYISTRAFETKRVNDYIFDRDFDREFKEDWMKLFSIFTEAESLAILGKYPSCCKYLPDEALLGKYIETKFGEGRSTNSFIDTQGLLDFHDCISYLPEPLQLVAKNCIEKIVDERVLSILQECANETNMDERRINERIMHYTSLSSKSYDKEKADCIAQIKQRKYDDAKLVFESRPSEVYSRNIFFGAFEQLGNEKEKNLASFIETIENVIERCAINGYVKPFLDLVEKLREVSPEKRLAVITRMQPVVIKYLRETAELVDGKNLDEINDYLEDYSSLMVLYGSEEKEGIRRVVSAALQKGKSVYPCLLSLVKGMDLFTIEEAFSFVSVIVQSWKFDDVNDFINNPIIISIKDEPRFAEIVIDKAFEFVWNRKLKDSYWEEENDNCYSNHTDFNCSFLVKLRMLCDVAGKKEKWEEFVLSRDKAELMEMLRHDVLKGLSENELKAIIDTIDLGSIRGVVSGLQWYYAPAIESQEKLNEICRKNGLDPFPMFAERLVSLDLTNVDNIYLAVLLTELLSIDRPDKTKDDYYTIRDWENAFKNHLVELKKHNAGNKHLATLLWSVYFQTSSSLDTLSEMFVYLPPYLQIRCVKKLFSLIEQGKVSYTAESLYKALNKGDGQMCLPLEIVFAYLKMRESNPVATLTNETMLQLLDGRNDHREWIGIRNLVTDCFGRWSAQFKDGASSRFYSDYYNGRMRVTEQGIIIYAPKQMINKQGQETGYNNKYFQSIQDLIRITYDNSDYKMTDNNGKGVAYLFKKEKEIELHALARAYNFDYGKEDISYEVYQTVEEEFCECRLSDSLDRDFGIAFNWCSNKPCYRPPLRFHVATEWEQYNVLDFMRILHIPTDYVNALGKRTKYGYYIILSSYLISFAKFYEHLKCRGCGQLMKPENVSNFAFRAVTQFSCVDENCEEYGKTVYLNHCFNTFKCNATIDSRDSKKCPNGQYICPECWACCSTENYRIRIANLTKTGGEISRWLMDFVNDDKGHWEKDEYYCYKCGEMAIVENDMLRCPSCQIAIKRPVYKTIRPKLDNKK